MPGWMPLPVPMHLFIPYIPVSRMFLRDQPKLELYMTPRNNDLNTSQTHLRILKSDIWFWQKD